VFHRGVGTAKLSGLLIDAKLDLLMDYTVFYLLDKVRLLNDSEGQLAAARLHSPQLLVDCETGAPLLGHADKMPGLLQAAADCRLHTRCLCRQGHGGSLHMRDCIVHVYVCVDAEYKTLLASCMCSCLIH